MKQVSLALGFVLAFTLGMLVRPHLIPAQAATKTSPATGWTIHIDAKRHFGAHPNEIAHHWCKQVAGMIECQIYDSDSPAARLVEVETIVQPGVYHAFTPAEQAYWHWHKVEVPKVDAVLPDMPAAQQKKFVASILPTYGKVWMLFDPMTTNDLPTGTPAVQILK
jgi:hypothetical protein